MSDGRHVDEEMGVLGGEGAQQKVGEREQRITEIAAGAWDKVPSERDLRESATYYDRPVLKHPVWKWYIAAYFVTGGAAGAAATLGAAAQVLGGESMRPLVRRSRWISAGGATVGTVFLVVDLGRPERFLNMLRVFRPTSPMSVGSWILAPFTGAAAVSLLPGPLGELAGLASGVLGVPLAGYTAVLTSNTAVPLWQQTRRTLPGLFVSSASASAASLLEAGGLGPASRQAARLFGILAKTADLGAGWAVEREAASVERVAKPLREGVSGTLWRAAKACTAASLVLSVVADKRPGARRLAALLGLAGSVGKKFALFRAGFASGRDPRATFEQQRAGYGGAGTTGRSASETVIS